MSKSSLIAQRVVFNGVMNEGGISNVDVNRKMLKFVNNAHSRYVEQLEKWLHIGKKGQKKKNHKWTEEGKGSKADVYRTTTKNCRIKIPEFQSWRTIEENATPGYWLKFVLFFLPICLFLLVLRHLIQNIWFYKQFFWWLFVLSYFV